MVAFLITAGVVVFQYNKYRVAPEMDFNTLALTNTSGQLVSISDASTDFVLICFFGTWCGSCIREVPSLELLASNHSNLSVYMVSDESAERLKKFQQAHPAVQVVCSERPLREAGIYTVPTAYLVNKSAEVLLNRVGENDWSTDAELLSRIGAAR